VATFSSQGEVNAAKPNRFIRLPDKDTVKLAVEPTGIPALRRKDLRSATQRKS